MNYQKIILAGEITNEPVIQKTKEGVLRQLKFEMTVEHFTDKVVFPVILTYVMNDIDGQEAVKGREVLVEGIIVTDKSGGFTVRADWMEKGSMVKENIKDLF
jgi:hypothetical protein